MDPILKWLAVASIALVAGGLAWQATRTSSASVEVATGEVKVLVTGPGTVQARVPVTVSARLTAHVVAVHADHGDRVRKGQLLAALDDRDLDARRASAAAARQSIEANVAAARANLAKARADLELSRNRHGRDRALLDSRFISQAAYDAAALGMKASEAAVESAAASLAARIAEARGVDEEARYAEVLWSHTRITAPMDGLVIQRAAEPGDMVTPGATIFRLVDPATIWIAARIDEALMSRVDLDMPATIRLRSGEVLHGRVARISRRSDTATRELEVNIALDAPPARFAIDQEAEVSITVGVERGPAVPVAAIVRREGEQGVYLLRDGRRHFQPLRVSASDERLAIVALGLDAGARLAPWTSH